MIDCFPFLVAFVRNVRTLTSVPRFIALLLFGQVFFSTLAFSLGVENRLVMLLFRASVAFCSACVILQALFLTKDNSRNFPLALAAFGFFIFLACYVTTFS